MTTLAALRSLIAQGESETLEFKRSTAGLRRAGEALCAFLNGEGGQVLIGVGPDGRLVGEQVADITLCDIAAMLGRFEPSARVELIRVDVGNDRQVIVLDAPSARQYVPFVFEAKPYKRVGSTTTVSRRRSMRGSCSIGTTAAIGGRTSLPSAYVSMISTGRRSFARGKPRSAAAALGRHEHGHRRHPRPARPAHRRADHAGCADALRDDVSARLSAGATQARALFKCLNLQENPGRARS